MLCSNMDLTLPENIKKILRDYGVKPSRERGQNFLVSREILDKMVAAANLKKDEEILEIGPGFGVLTAELAKRAKRIVAVEADRKLAKILKKNVENFGNVEIVENDILKLQVTGCKLQEYKYKIVANLPYQITSAVFRKFLNDGPQPAEITVMVQREVAERICAPAGKGSLLSLSVQFFGQPEIVEIVPRSVFWPEPEVDSAILKISRIKETSGANLKKIDSEKFFKIAKIGFSARRKQLHNNLSAGLMIPDGKVWEIMAALGFDPKIRAQNLSLEDWVGLTGRLLGK